MDRSDKVIDADSPSIDAAFMASMKPTRRGRPKLVVTKVDIKTLLDADTAGYLRFFKT